MLWFLRFLFIAVLGSMLCVTSWASMRVSVLAIPREVFTHPWFIAVMLLGNLAMSIYLLTELFRIKKSAQLTEVISRRNPGRLALPGALVAASIGIYLLA